MQRSLTPILAGYIAVAALVFAAPKPALAMSAVAPAVANASIVQQIGYRHYRGYRNYGYRNYGYRNYGYGYRRYGYGGYGYRPYGYGYRPYGYYGGMAIPIGARVSASGSVSNDASYYEPDPRHCRSAVSLPSPTILERVGLDGAPLAAAARRPAINHMFTLIAAAQRTMI